MALKLSRHLGHYAWDARCDGITTGGCGPIWSDPAATPEQLMADLAEHTRAKVRRLELYQWRRVGRTIERVLVKTVEGTSLSPRKQSTEQPADHLLPEAVHQLVER